MPRTYKLCTDYVPGVGGHAVTGASPDEVATRERVDNVRVEPIRPGRSRIGIPGARNGSRTRAAVERLKLWENGRRLRIKFLDGDGSVKEKVAAIAKEWER